MEKYTLFLDESNDKDKGLIFVAGFAIPNSQLELFSDYILDIKKLIWDEDYINNNTTILHCTELRTIYNNRRNPETGIEGYTRDNGACKDFLNQRGLEEKVCPL